MDIIGYIDNATPNIKERLDEFEVALSQQDQVECPLIHRFTPGLYSREIFMPEGALIISKIHKTRHQFVISDGTALVKINDGEWKELSAPWTGITEIGTRRVLYIAKNCTWTTFHPIEIAPIEDTTEAIKMAVSEIEDIIIEKNQAVIDLKGELLNIEESIKLTKS